MLLVPKPIKHIAYKEIARIEMHRLSASMTGRNFDFEVITKSNQKFMFSSIDKNESEGLKLFFKSK